MKKILSFAVVAATLFTTSCLVEGGGTDTPGNEGRTELIISLATPDQSTRAVSNPASPSNLANTLESGYIFIINNGGDYDGLISDMDEFDSGDINGLTLGTYKFGSGSGSARVINRAQSDVFVVGNPTNAMKVLLESAMSLADIKAVKADIMQHETNHQKPVMANAGGTATAIEITQVAEGATPATGKVELNIAPVVSRIEIGSITAGDNIQVFTVADIALSHYYPEYTLAGGYYASDVDTSPADGYGDNFVLQPDDPSDGATPLLTNTLGDFSLSSTATESGSVWSTNAGEGKVWAYQVTAGTLPQIYVRLNNIASTAPEQTGSGPKYIKITGYTNNSDDSPVTEFEPGQIYTITDIKFQKNHIGLENENIDFTAGVDVGPWTPTDTTPVVDDKTKYAVSYTTPTNGLITAKVYQADGLGDTVVFEENAVQLPENRKITITATPLAGYKFVKWALTGTKNTLTKYELTYPSVNIVVGTSAVTIVAEFAAIL